MTTAFEARGERNGLCTEALIDAYVNSTGTAPALLDKFMQTSDDVVRDLSELVVTLAYRAAEERTLPVQAMRHLVANLKGVALHV